MPWGPTSLASSLPKGTEDKDPSGFPGEGWPPLAHNATDMLSPGQWGARPCSWGLGENLSREGGASLHRRNLTPIH